MDVAVVVDQSVGDVAVLRRLPSTHRRHIHRACRDGAGDRRPARNRDLIYETWPKNLLIESIISFGIGLVITLVFCFFAAEILQLNKQGSKRSYSYDVEITIPKKNFHEYGSEVDAQSLAIQSWQVVRILEKKNSQKLRVLLNGDVQIVVAKNPYGDGPTCPVCFYDLTEFLKANIWEGRNELAKVISFQIKPTTSYSDSLKCIEKHFM